MALPPRVRNSAALIALIAGCVGGPPPDWQLAAMQALNAYRDSYFAGNARAAESAFSEARSQLARTGSFDLVARAELARCAVRTASLEFDGCPGFEALRSDAGPEERAYADYLAGRGSHSVDENDALSRLVAYGVRLRTGAISPAEIDAAIETASAQGWRRPLLAWLGLQAQRAEAAGDAEMAARLRRRMKLVTQ